MSALDHARQALREAMNPAAHLDAALARLAAWWSGNGRNDELNDEDRDRLHAFLRRFEQLYDLIGRKMLRALLVVAAEDPKEYTLRQLFHWAEKCGAIPSAESWIRLGELRNRLVHDYPTGTELQLPHVTEAMAALPELHAAHAMLVAHLEQALA